jgi:hypothetical protein
LLVKDRRIAAVTERLPLPSAPFLISRIFASNPISYFPLTTNLAKFLDFSPWFSNIPEEGRLGIIYEKAARSEGGKNSGGA